MKATNKIIIVLIVLFLMTSCSLVPIRHEIFLSGNKYSRSFIDDSSIKVLNWNIHKEGNKDTWRSDFSYIATQKRPDIVLFQEVRLGEELKNELNNFIQMGWEFSPNIFETEHDAYSGVLTASHSRPIAVDALISNGLEPIADTPKTVLMTKYILNPSRNVLLVVNVHGINFRIGLGEFKKQMSSITNTVAQHNGPVIMSGDFNTWNQSRLDYLFSSAEKVGLRAVNFASEGKKIKSAFGNPLDHIFFRKDQLEIITGSQDVLENIDSSDHKALFVEFKVK